MVYLVISVSFPSGIVANRGGGSSPSIDIENAKIALQ
jgi:hypothetical protein